MHPTGTTINFFDLRVYGHFEQKNLKTPYVPDGCTYWSRVLGLQKQVPKVYFDAIFDDENFRKFYSLILREFGPIGCFGTHFHRVMKIVLEVVHAKYGYSEAGKGRLIAFCGWPAPKIICAH